MKKYIQYSLFLLTFGIFYSCSNDTEAEGPAIQPVKEASISIKLASDFTTERYNVVAINPEVSIENGNDAFTQYKWTTKVTSKDGVVKDSIIGNTKTLQFIVPKADNYTLDLTVSFGEVVKQASTRVKVTETAKTYNSKALFLIDYLPAPCTNMTRLEFATKAEVLSKIQSDLTDGESIPLGTFGGYIVTKFDHTVINSNDKRDFTIEMASNSASKYSPVSVYVAYDANKNGIAEENEWYEIAGSEYNKSTTVKNYEMTYFKPDPNKTAVTGIGTAWEFDKEYLKWTNNKNESGYVTKTTRNRRDNYYPQWLGDSYTLKGTKIFLPTKDISDGAATTFNVGTYEWGYGGIKDPSIDISWAVDKEGKKVHLPGIDFVKVYVPTFTALGASDLLISLFNSVEDLNFVK